MALMASWKYLLEETVLWFQLVLESLSVFCVALGLITTIRLVVQIQRHRRRGEEFPYNQLRLKFGTWLAVALEFQLGADILATTVAPNLDDLLRLGIVAAVRTFLNYFLGKELEAEMAMEHREQEHQAKMAQTYGSSQI